MVYSCSHHYQFYKTETKHWFWIFGKKRSVYRCSECGHIENGFWKKVLARIKGCS